MPRGRTRSRSTPRARSMAPSRSRSMSSNTQNAGAASVSFVKPRAGNSFKGKSVKALMNYVKQNLPAPEKKYILHDLSINGASATGKPNITPWLLNALPRGDTVQNRTGDIVSLGRGKYKGQISTTNGTSVCRVMIIMDKRPNATQLTNAMIFGTSTPSAWSFLDFNNSDVYSRFTILCEKTYDVTDSVAGSLAVVANQAVTQIDLSWDCNHYTASYKKGNAGSIADIDDGAIYLCIQQGETQGSGGSGAIGIVGNIVQYFTDL